MITEVRKYKTTDGDPDLQTRFRSNPRVLRRELRMSSTELAATSTTRENAGELKPHAASKLILRVIQNLVKLGQLQQSLARRALSQVQPKRRIGHEEFDSPFSLKSVRDGSDVRCGIWPWQKLEETITHLAGLAWSPVGRTATRTGSARPTRLPAGSGLPSGTVFQVQVTIYPRKSRNI